MRIEHTDGRESVRESERSSGLPCLRACCYTVQQATDRRRATCRASQSPLSTPTSPEREIQLKQTNTRTHPLLPSSSVFCLPVSGGVFVLVVDLLSIHQTTNQPINQTSSRPKASPNRLLLQPETLPGPGRPSVQTFSLTIVIVTIIINIPSPSSARRRVVYCVHK